MPAFVRNLTGSALTTFEGEGGSPRWAETGASYEGGGLPEPAWASEEGVAIEAVSDPEPETETEPAPESTLVQARTQSNVPTAYHSGRCTIADNGVVGYGEYRCSAPDKSALASLIGRGMRFISLAFLVLLFGEDVKRFISGNFELLTAGMGVIVVIILLAYLLVRRGAH